MSEEAPSAFPLYRGNTRSPMPFGVPLVPLIAIFLISFTITVEIRWWLGIAIFLLAGLALRLIVQDDDKRLRIIGLFFATTLRNRFSRFWGASSYSPIRYRRPGGKIIKPGSEPI